VAPPRAEVTVVGFRDRLVPAWTTNRQDLRARARQAGLRFKLRPR
jgi:hypothetical protein